MFLQKFTIKITKNYRSVKSTFRYQFSKNPSILSMPCEKKAIAGLDAHQTFEDPLARCTGETSVRRKTSLYPEL